MTLTGEILGLLAGVPDSFDRALICSAFNGEQEADKQQADMYARDYGIDAEALRRAILRSLAHDTERLLAAKPLRARRKDTSHGKAVDPQPEAVDPSAQQSGFDL